MMSNTGIDTIIANEIYFLLQQDISGCITGGCLLPDKNLWSTKPDVDIFCYSSTGQVQAVTTLLALGYKLSSELDKWKWKNQVKRDFDTSKKQRFVTLKLDNPDNDIQVNISWHSGRTTPLSVIGQFDLSIIMKCIDIQSGVTHDLTCVYEKLGASPTKAIFNPNNEINLAALDIFDAMFWTRQFDRCIKYWDRGYDTRQPAQYYLDLIDKKLSVVLFENSEKVATLFTELKERREKIATWLTTVNQ
jgi:hypothetical protein